MIPLVLTAEEVRVALDGKLTEIRRPFTEANDSVPAAYRKRVGGAPDFADAVFPDGSGAGWIAWWGRGPFSAEETARLYPAGGVPCPFGAPGDLLFVQETWAAHWMYDNVSAEQARSTRPGDNRWYQADGEDAPGSCGCPAVGRRGRWRDASTLLACDSRLALRNRGVRVERVDGVWTWIVAVERVDRPNGAPMPPAGIGGLR